MKIENNILKHYLKNVYFITGTAYAGKSTTVKMLAERYDMICCGENNHMAVSEIVATPENAPRPLLQPKPHGLERFRHPHPRGI